MVFWTHLIAFAILAIPLTIFLVKKYRRDRIAFTGLGVVLFLGLFSVSLEHPPELLFLTFSTPEAAVEYAKFGTIQEVLEGEDTYMVCYHGYKEGDTFCIVEKRGDRCRINPYLTPENVNTPWVSEDFLYINRIRVLDDFYLYGIEQVPTDAEITDSLGTSLTFWDSPDFRVFGAYLKDYQEPYSCYVDGEAKLSVP